MFASDGPARVPRKAGGAALAEGAGRTAADTATVTTAPLTATAQAMTDRPTRRSVC